MPCPSRLSLAGVPKRIIRKRMRCLALFSRSWRGDASFVLCFEHVFELCVWHDPERSSARPEAVAPRFLPKAKYRYGAARPERSGEAATASGQKNSIIKLCLMSIINENDQANRAISTGKLHTLLRFHTRPINVVVFHGSQGNTRFQVGFPLRCLQRLSLPYIATLLCPWQDNRSTRDMSIPVLSY